jgi:hypothetical protein
MQSRLHGALMFETKVVLHVLGHKSQMYTGNVEHSPGFVDVESYKDCNAVISHSLPGKIQFLCRFCDWDLNHQPLQMLERQ